MKKVLFLSFVFCGFLSFGQIIPKPVSQTFGDEFFTIDRKTSLIFDANDREITELSDFLVDKITELSGISLAKNKSEYEKKIIFRKENKLHFQNNSILNKSKNIEKEGYRLSVNPQRIEIVFTDTAGGFYGIQSLLQLLPMVRTNTTLTIQTTEIEDFPSFAWRGMMLDVSRHFQTIENIKQTLDMLAFYKINTFQWHLCDNEGWRLEVKKFPKLTEIGAWRKEIPKARMYQKDTIPQGEKYIYGGYYTQEQAREIVEYARKRHITIIPEIEMPGHSGAALAAYPQYSCRQNNQETPNSILHHSAEYTQNFSLEYCAGNDEVFTFLEDILTEVFDIFPSEYIHIGGDEVDKSHWKNCKKCQKRIKKEKLTNEDELQSYFIKRMEKFLTKNNRKLLGWDEILEGGLAKTATVMSWRGEKGGIEAAKMNHDVVMAPSNPLYFIRHQDENEIAKYHAPTFSINTLESVYAYNPLPEALTEAEQKYVLGSQFSVWTEFMSSVTHYQYMVYPRMQAFAEAVWTSSENKNFNDFVRRLNAYHFDGWKLKGINFFPKYYDKTPY